MERHQRGVRGFTLVEMMVVLVVIGLILLATIPAVSSYMKSSRLAGSASMLASDLHYARALANSQHTAYEMRLSTGGYSLVRLQPATTVLTRTLPRGITIGTVDSTTFYSWGLTEPAVITLQQPDRSKVVRLSASGQVTRE